MYRRISGRKRSLLGYSQLWLGPDHLLLVKSNRFVEQYLRFYLADIQALVITELRGWTILQALIVAFAIAWMLAALAVDSSFAKGFFISTGALILAAIAIDAARGPRCLCHLYTAVSRVRLDPVSRVRQAHEFIERLKPEIEASQRTLATADSAALEEHGPQGTGPAPPQIVSPFGYLVEIVFGLFLLDAVLLLLNLRFPDEVVGQGLITAFFAEMVLVIVALFRREAWTRGRVVSTMLVLALIGMSWDTAGMMSGFGDWVQQVIQSIREGSQVTAAFVWQPVRKDALLSAAWRLVAGGIGLAIALNERRNPGVQRGRLR